MEPNRLSAVVSYPRFENFLCGRFEGAGMSEQIGYCWQKAAEYAARAEEAPDKEMREVFIRFRNWWRSAAERYQPSRGPAAAKGAEPRPSPRPPELGTSEWYRRPTEGLTSAPAERLGAA
jgi:hypothetical protein